jgi:hypothetical protein
MYLSLNNHGNPNGGLHNVFINPDKNRCKYLTGS